jgi:hypothetical protein
MGTSMSHNTMGLDCYRDSFTRYLLEPERPVPCVGNFTEENVCVIVFELLIGEWSIWKLIKRRWKSTEVSEEYIVPVYRVE